MCERPRRYPASLLGAIGNDPSRHRQPRSRRIVLFTVCCTAEYRVLSLSVHLVRPITAQDNARRTRSHGAGSARLGILCCSLALEPRDGGTPSSRGSQLCHACSHDAFPQQSRRSDAQLATAATKLGLQRCVKYDIREVSPSLRSTAGARIETKGLSGKSQGEAMCPQQSQHYCRRPTQRSHPAVACTHCEAIGRHQSSVKDR